MNLDWSAIAAIATSVAAGVTAWMAYMTRRSVQQAHEHHQDAYRPILVLATYDGVDPSSRNDLLKPMHGRTWNALLLYCILKNIGVGPATRIKVTVRVMDIEGYGFEREVSPMRAGETYGKSGEPIRIPVTVHQQFNETDLQGITNPPWEIFIEYTDVFGQMFHTIHPKNPLQPWTTLGKGSAPAGANLRPSGERR